MKAEHYYATFLGGLVFLVGVFFLASGKAEANPSSLVYGCKTAPATSTVVYMTGGTATTTIICDLMGSGGSRLAENATLTLFRNFSNAPASVQKVTYEYSNDYTTFAPAASTWYTVSTTTPNNPASPIFTWIPASTTWSGAPGAPKDYDATIIDVPVKARWVKAVITVPVGAASSTVWGEIVKKVENF